MKILDANMILRFLLRDNEEMADTVCEILSTGRVMVTTEVIAESVYVLEKVYKIERREIQNALCSFLQIENVTSPERRALMRGLQFYAEHKLDFVDCLLCGYRMEHGYEICTFDKKLNRLLGQLEESAL